MNFSLEDSANLMYLIWTTGIITIWLFVPTERIRRFNQSHETRKAMVFNKLFGTEDLPDQQFETLV